MIQYRLGMKIFSKEGIFPACGASSDPLGDHALSCASNGARIVRHNLLSDCLYETAAQIALAPAREERSLIPGSQSRPADVYLPSWANWRDAASDVTVVSPLCYI